LKPFVISSILSKGFWIVMIILFHFRAEVVAVDKSLTYVKLPINTYSE